MTSRESPGISQLASNVNNQVVEGIDTKLTIDIPNERHNDKKPVEISARTGKPKRRKAVRACTNCQRTHLTCDDDRPCERCVKRGCADTCVDGERKKPKRSRAKALGSQAKSEISQYVPDLLLSQGQMAPLDLTPPPNQYQHHPLNTRMQSSLTTNNLLSHITHSIPQQQLPPQGGALQQPPRQHIPLTNTLIDLPTQFNALGQLQKQIQPSDTRLHHAVLGSYGLIPEYLAPVDSYPLSSQSPLNRFASEIQGSRLSNKDGSVISAMLQSRSNINNSEDPEDGINELQQASDGSGGYEAVSGSNDEEPGAIPREHQSILPWLDPPTNPLVSAHNEHSRRFSYNYEHTDPSEVYRRVTEPYPNRRAFHQMIKYLKKRLQPEDFRQIVGFLTKLKTRFGSITRPLSHEDNLFVEQSFQRSLLEEEKQFALTPVPCLVWRRSGIVAAVSPRFSKLTQWTPEDLKDGFIMQAMNNESIFRYVENFQSAITNQLCEFKFDCGLLTPTGEEIATEAEVSIRKDLFNMPLTIVGKFWVKS